MMAQDPRASSRTVADPVFGLVKEVEDLKRQMAEKDREIAELREEIKVKVNSYQTLLKDVSEMKEAMEALSTQATLHRDSKYAHLDIRDEIKAIQSRPPTRSDITTDRLSRLDNLLFNCYPRSLTFDEIGKLLQFGENHTQIMNRFSKHLFPYADERYIFGDAEGRPGTGKTVRLTPGWRAHLEKNKISWDGE